jgi:aldehyde dehydrogenase
MLYAAPGTPGAKLAFKAALRQLHRRPLRAAADGRYFDVITPITARSTRRPRARAPPTSSCALDAAHAAAPRWAATPPAERANLLLKIADRIEQNLELLAYAETSTTASRSARR